MESGAPDGSRGDWARRGITRFFAAAVGSAALVLLALVGSASGAPYHSPGYQGTKAFRNDTQAPLAPIALGTGKYPNLLVDRSGTAHIVFAQDGGQAAPDTLAFCNLQRGLKSCASAGLAPNPQAKDSSEGGEFAGNFPAGNHDFDGPAPLVVGNQLFVLDRRFPDVFTTPAGSSSSNVFEWSSVDGGATITGPGLIGDNQMAGGAIAFGDPSAPSVGTLSRTQTGGTTFQGVTSQYATAKAQLGTGDQAYDGSVALDGRNPVAAFADLTGHVFVRKWSGQGDVNDAANWSETSFSGYSPRIVGAAAGVFVLYSDRQINGGTLRLRRIVGGAPSGAPVTLGRSDSEPAISEDPSGAISFAYTDPRGVQVRTSTNGVDFSPPQFTAAIPPNGSIAHLVTAATADGGGFVSFVRNPSGGEGVGQVTMAAFGEQRATRQPGLGPLPGGGIGSSAGDQLATASCQHVKFGVVDAAITGPCYGHDPNNPNLSVTLGEVNLNGLRIIPDPGVRIGIDFRRHTIDTTGKVRVVLSASGIPDITLWHDELHIMVPNDGPGDTLVDLKNFAGQIGPVVQGFPVNGDVDIKLAGDGVNIPISLTLPKVFGGVTGSATLHVTMAGGLQLTSLEFKVGDANLGAVELKDVDVTYELQGDHWKGMGKLLIPAGGGALSAAIAVEFAAGNFKSGSLDLGLAYPGLPIDVSDTPPQLFLSHAGFGLSLDPLTLSGDAGLGITQLKPIGEGDPMQDYVFRLEGQLSVAFGAPVTITLGATGFLYNVKLAQATLVYKIPDQVSLTGRAEYALGMFHFTGDLGAIIDPKARLYGAQIKARAFLKMPDPFSDVPLPGSFALAVNNQGFGAFVGFPGVPIPIPPYTFIGNILYRWGDAAPSILPGLNDATGPFRAGIPVAAPLSVRAHAAAVSSFTIPARAPTASLIVHGAGGAPQIALTGPGGQPVAIDGKYGQGEHVESLADSTAAATYVGIQHPRAGRWTVVQAPGSQVPVTSIEYSIGEAAPRVSGTSTGRAFKRTLRYRAAIPAGVTVTFAEQAKGLLHVIGRVRGRSGAIAFRPASGPVGRRALIAQIASNGLPLRNQTVATYVVPRPPRPGRAARLRVRAGRQFSFSFSPPANAARILILIVATDGRHLNRVVAPRTRGGSVPVIGFRDGVSVTVVGLGVDGSRGPAVTAKVRRRR